MSEQCRVGESMAGDYYEHVAECPECEEYESERTRTHRRPFSQIALALVRFQENYQRNVLDYAPGNEHYAGQLLAIVDDARKAFALPPRPTVAETMDEKSRGEAPSAPGGSCASRTCPKVAHSNRGGYLHGADDDSPFDVDGVRYCGRCHMAL